MKVLIVGANGLLGRELTSTCLQKGWTVECVYNTHSDAIPNICRSYSSEGIETIRTAYNTIYLLAAHIPAGGLTGTLDELWKSNMLLPYRIAKKFPNTRIVFSSSVAVYGNQAGIVYEETSFQNPGLYGLSKIAGETILRLHGRYSIVRFSSIYGPRMKTKTFIPTIIQNAMKDKQITVFGKGLRQQNYIHVADAVGFLLAAAQKDTNGIYLGVDGLSYRNIDVAKMVATHIRGCVIRYHGEDADTAYIYNNTKTTEVLRYHPTIELKDGISQFFTV